MAEAQDLSPTYEKCEPSSSAFATSSSQLRRGLINSDVIDKALESLSFEEKGDYQWWRKGKSELKILAVGKTGVGKSTLLNGLFGLVESTDKFAVGKTLKPGTTSVCTRTYIRSGILLVIHDSPGLEDGTGKESEYLRQIKSQKEKGVDLMLYCISMKETRTDLSSDVDHTAINKLTRELGKDIWNHTVFILTRANTFVKVLAQQHDADSVQEHFDKRVIEWKEKISEALLKNSVDASVANNVQVVPAGHYNKKSLLDRTYWLSDLWARVFVAVSDSGKLAFLKLAENRLKIPSDVTDEDFKKEIQDQPIVIASTLPGKEKNKSLDLLSRLWQKICDFVQRRSKSKVDLRKKPQAQDYNTWM